MFWGVQINEITVLVIVLGPGGRLTKTYDVITLEISQFIKLLTHREMHILRCMGSKFCVKFQRAPLKFHTKFWTHTPKLAFYWLLFLHVTNDIFDVISLIGTGAMSVSGSALVRVMTRDRSGGKTSPNEWCLVGNRIEIKKIHLNISSAKWRPFCSGFVVSFIYMYMFWNHYWMGTTPLKLKCHFD